MVVKTPPISSEIAARMAAENARQFAGDTKAKEMHEIAIVRMWCIEQAVAVCGSELGVLWKEEMSGRPHAHSAVVSIAEEVLRFITSDSEP